MMEDKIGAALLLLVGIVSLAMHMVLMREYRRREYTTPCHALWGASFFVLFVSGVLIIIYDWSVLKEPLVPVVAALIPVGFAAGLYYAVWPDRPYGRYYLFYALAGIIFIAIVWVGIDDEESALNPISVMLVHIPSGLSMVLVPAIAARKQLASGAAYFFSAGGLCMSLGGVLLAFVEADKPILEVDTIHTVLPLLLVIVGVLLVLGILLPKRWNTSLAFIEPYTS